LLDIFLEGKECDWGISDTNRLISFSLSLSPSLFSSYRCRVMTRGMVEDYIYLRREMFIDVCAKRGLEGGKGGREWTPRYPEEMAPEIA